jgi:hypothetical protein
MKGVGIWYWVGDRLYFQRQHRRQPTPRSDAEAFNRSTLYWSTQVVKYMDAYQRHFAQQLSARTQLAAQDFLYLALFGRIGHLVRVDGRKVYSLAAVQDVSSLLDTIGQLKNNILVRGETWWEPIPDGTPGQVLTIKVDGSIGWADAAGGGGAPWFMEPPPMSPDTASAIFGGNAFAAVPFMPENDVTITGLRMLIVTPGSGHTTYPGLYDANPSNNSLQGGSLKASGSSVALTAGLMDLPFSAPVDLVAGQWYWGGPVILGAGNINLAQGFTNRTIRFFGQTTTSLPATAGVASASANNNTTWWFY